MTRTLDYASPPKPPVTWRRVLLLVVYYGGWSVGGVVGGAIMGGWLMDQVQTNNRAVLVGGALTGGLAAATIAYASRRTRGPQVVALVIGAAGTAFACYVGIEVYRAPRSFLWGLAVIVALIFLGGGVSWVGAGIAGIILTRWRPETK